MKRGKARGGVVPLQWLEEGKNGVFHASDVVFEEREGALVRVRSEWVPPIGRRRAGFRLITQRSRILSARPVD